MLLPLGDGNGEATWLTHCSGLSSYDCILLWWLKAFLLYHQQQQHLMAQKPEISLLSYCALSRDGGVVNVQPSPQT